MPDSTPSPAPDPSAPKPSLALLSPNKASLEQIVAFYRRLTGREPTPEEIERARIKLAGRQVR